ncbi:MAG: pyruvate kinase [Bacteroidia bacterium]|jgi:pyruvate kinase|nr:pyruvate kinase [Bacteroidia bacterium]
MSTQIQESERIQFNRTKIVATLGPASSTPEMLEEMARAGADVFRINFSHGKYDDVITVVKHIREVNRKLGTHISILGDLQGPKLRIGVVENNGVEIKEGQILTFTTHEMTGTAEKVYITYPQFPKDVKVDENILIDDGKLVLRVVSTNKTDEVQAQVVHGGILSSKKGVNLPNTRISLPCLTPKDLQDLEFALQQQFDWIGLSFVRSGADIIELKHIIRNIDPASKARVIAKIEKPEAVSDIDNIIRETDALMVARGDLGVEVPMQRVPVIQKMLVRKCLAASKPVIIATQMMESMITNISPSRAEVNDVANSVMDGADAVMLSGETSVGKHPHKVVEAMSKIIAQVEEEHTLYYGERPPLFSTDERYVSDHICYAATQLARHTNAAAIITMTQSGYTAFRISSYRPRASIFVFTDNYSILTQLSLVWGVRGYYYDKNISTDHTIADIKFILKKEGLVVKDDFIVNTASIPLSEKGKSNMIKLSIVE